MSFVPAIERFVEVVRAYCTWVESPPASPAQEARLALGFLVRLYGRALELPELFGDEEAERMDHSEWQRTYHRFDALPFNYYGRISNPLAVPSDAPAVADLADDLADIWSDLRPGLRLFDAGHVGAAVWEWRNSFSSHWGHHAASGIYALHSWLVGSSKDAVAC